MDRFWDYIQYLVEECGMDEDAAYERAYRENPELAYASYVEAEYARGGDPFYGAIDDPWANEC